MKIFQEEHEKYYGFHFMDDNHNFRLLQTHLPVDQLELEHLLHDAKDYSREVEFKVIFGFVKELIVFNEKIYLNSPSKVGGEKYQAFIFKRNGDIVANEGAEFFINGLKIDFSFSLYNVTIIDI